MKLLLNLGQILECLLFVELELNEPVTKLKEKGGQSEISTMEQQRSLHFHERVSVVDSTLVSSDFM